MSEAAEADWPSPFSPISELGDELGGEKSAEGNEPGAGQGASSAMKVWPRYVWLREDEGGGTFRVAAQGRGGGGGGGAAGGGGGGAPAGRGGGGGGGAAGAAGAVGTASMQYLQSAHAGGGATVVAMRPHVP